MFRKLNTVLIKIIHLLEINLKEKMSKTKQKNARMRKYSYSLIYIEFENMQENLVMNI